MQVKTNIPLARYLTMKLGGTTRFMAIASTPNDVLSICMNAKKQSLPIFVLGGGSNIIAKDTTYDGIIILNKIMGFEIDSQDTTSITLKIGAGENWDEVVARTVEMGLTGIEAMSAIPGTAGASPVQNVGAYGQEIADTLTKLEAYDNDSGMFVTIDNESCGFSYRNSVFKSTEKTRYIITYIYLRLYISQPNPPYYEAVQRYLDENAITLVTPLTIREAVINIRKKKLPDPALLPNTGSFFKNAIVDEWKYTELLKNWPDMPSYPLGDKQVKIPTGWLIEHCGMKGALLHGMRVHDKNALVLINESATSYDDLAKARNEIIANVRDKFQILIEQEPIEL